MNSQKLADRNITEKDVANPLPIVLTAAAPQVHAGANEVRIVKSGGGVLYWSASATFFGANRSLRRRAAHVLNVVRKYFKLVPERQDNRIVYSEQPVSGPVQTGDVVEVRLTGSATHDEQYLQIEDPIPAGSSADDPEEGLREIQWRAFLDREVTPRFPDGLTVLDAYGQWRARGSEAPSRLRSKVLVILYEDTPANRAAIDAIRVAYKASTRDQSVLLVTERVDVSF